MKDPRFDYPPISYQKPGGKKVVEFGVQRGKKTQNNNNNKKTLSTENSISGKIVLHQWVSNYDIPRLKQKQKQLRKFITTRTAL